MFDLSNMKSSQMDNLQPWRIFALAREAESTSGRVWPCGAEFRFDYAIANLLARTAEVHGFSPTGEKMIFAMPYGEHRNLFVFTGREWTEPEPEPEPAPPGGEEAWKTWLAAQPGFERAAAIVKGARSSGDWGASRNDADVVRKAAVAFAKKQPAVARWLADRSLNLYYSWMSQATSGGEGTAMEHEVRDYLAELRGILNAK